MKLEARKYLHDIERAATLIEEFVAGKGASDYAGDAMLRSAVERQFEIIGEAVGQLARADESTAEQIGDYQQIIAFRNILIHGYADVDDRLVWNVIETRLRSLIAEVRGLLASGE